MSSAKKGRGLGRGLDGLLAAPAAETAAPVLSKPIPAIGGTPLELKIVEIERSPYQPRREFKEEELQELAESLQNNGLIQPPTVRKNEHGKYECYYNNGSCKEVERLSFLLPEQVGMCTRVEHDENEFRVVLLPDEQPVWLDVTLPLSLTVAMKFVRLVFSRQATVTLKQFHRLS